MANGSRENSVLLLGLPGSGKSTYIGALAQMLESDGHNGCLILERYSEDRNELEALANEWLRCKPVSRTEGQSTRPIELVVRDSASNEIIKINVPDLSGETFERHCERRTCSQEYAELASGANCAILFVHSNRTYQNHPMEPGDTGQAPEDGTEILGDDWGPNKVSGQSKLVEILQTLLFLRDSDSPLRVAIMISAWDLVQSALGTRDPMTPSQFLNSNIALLAQYLECNSQIIEFVVFGVSAQGGNYDDDVTRTCLLEKRPWERGIVTEVDGDHNDLSRPLRWLCFGKQ